jgi:hypothetical protein
LPGDEEIDVILFGTFGSIHLSILSTHANCVTPTMRSIQLPVNHKPPKDYWVISHPFCPDFLIKVAVHLHHQSRQEAGSDEC